MFRFLSLYFWYKRIWKTTHLEASTNNPVTSFSCKVERKTLKDLEPFTSINYGHTNAIFAYFCWEPNLISDAGTRCRSPSEPVGHRCPSGVDFFAIEDKEQHNFRALVHRGFIERLDDLVLPIDSPRPFWLVGIFTMISLQDYLGQTKNTHCDRHRVIWGVLRTFFLISLTNYELNAKYSLLK